MKAKLYQVIYLMEEKVINNSRSYLDSYIIEATTNEEAFDKTKSLQKILSDSYRSNSGEIVELCVKGMFNLIDLQINDLKKELNEGLQLEPINLDSEFKVKEKKEFDIFKNTN